MSRRFVLHTVQPTVTQPEGWRNTVLEDRTPLVPPLTPEQVLERLEHTSLPPPPVDPPRSQSRARFSSPLVFSSHPTRSRSRLAVSEHFTFSQPRHSSPPSTSPLPQHSPAPLPSPASPSSFAHGQTSPLVLHAETVLAVRHENLASTALQNSLEIIQDLVSGMENIHLNLGEEGEKSGEGLELKLQQQVARKEQKNAALQKTIDGYVAQNTQQRRSRVQHAFQLAKHLEEEKKRQELEIQRLEEARKQQALKEEEERRRQEEARIKAAQAKKEQEERAKSEAQSQEAARQQEAQNQAAAAHALAQQQAQAASQAVAAANAASLPAAAVVHRGSSTAWNAFRFYRQNYFKLEKVVQDMKAREHSDMRKRIKKMVVTSFNTLSAKRQQVVSKVKNINSLLDQTKSNPLYYQFALSEICANLCRQGQTQVASRHEVAFPYIWVLEYVRRQHGAIGDVFVQTLAHACPYVVPIPLSLRKNAGLSIPDFKVDFLGYKRKLTDGLESFDQYTNRMVGLVHMYATYLIVPTTQNDESHERLPQAWTWLARLLNAPASNISAFILLAFLEKTSFYLNGTYKEQFHKLLSVIYDEFIPSIKGNEAAAPRTRLKLYIETFLRNGRRFDKPSGSVLEA